MSVVVGDKDHRTMGRLLENTLALFLAVMSIFLIVASAWLVQALLVYRACGFVFWTSSELADRSTNTLKPPACLANPRADVLPRWW